ncbi:MAG: nodulation protein NfeD [Nitrospinae bacterium]|nr:nodulation protein NfeD [Nitrospinota bacterium]
MNVKRFVRAAFSLSFALAGLFSLAASSSAGGKSALVITVNGPISPVSAEYIVKGIQAAEADPAVETLIIEMDTPGGLDTSMRQIIKEIQRSPKPVVVYVAPSGSRAASAGAFITMAAHVAAMAPGTNIGAASPVNMGGEGMDKTMKRKVTNDAAAYIRSIAEQRGRNADIGEEMVRAGASLSETEAVREKVADLVAEDLPSLLAAINGRTVKTGAGDKTLATAGLEIKRLEMNWRERIFDALANPNVAYILMMLGFYGLFFELSNPGAVLPGIIGAICLILAFYSLQTLPVNYAGALLIILAIILFLLEIWVPSYGTLTMGGVIALVIGSLMLIDSPDEYMRISLSVIISMTLFTAAFFFFLVGSGVCAQYRRVTTGAEGMAGAIGEAQTDIVPETGGEIFVSGELWSALPQSGHITKGARVEVTGQKGLTLTVREKPE